jgi:site-specific DNA-methyltransferase (adenine-specific)
MKQIPDGSVDMVMTDPPYGTTACKWDSIIPLEPMWEHLKRVIKPNSAIVMTASQPFTTTLIASNMKMFKYELIWDKTQGKQPMLAHKRPMKSHENLCVFYSAQPTYNPQMRSGEAYKDNRSKGNYSVHRGHTKAQTKEYKGRFPLSISAFPMPNRASNHPTQKPVALMEYLIKTYTNKGETVLDFTMGSGTTGVACINLERGFIGIEKDDKYFEIAKNRIQEAIDSKKSKLF